MINESSQFMKNSSERKMNKDDPERDIAIEDMPNITEESQS